MRGKKWGIRGKEGEGELTANSPSPKKSTNSSHQGSLGVRGEVGLHTEKRGKRGGGVQVRYPEKPSPQSEGELPTLKRGGL